MGKTAEQFASVSMLAPLAGGQQFRPYMTFYVVEPCIRSKYTDCTDVFQSDVLSEGLSPQTQSSLRLWLLRSDSGIARTPRRTSGHQCYSAAYYLLLEKLRKANRLCMGHDQGRCRTPVFEVWPCSLAAELVSSFFVHHLL